MTYAQTDGQTHTQPGRPKDKQTHTDRRLTHRQAHRHTHIDTQTLIRTEIHKQIQIVIYRAAQKQVYR